MYTAAHSLAEDLQMHVWICQWRQVIDRKLEIVESVIVNCKKKKYISVYTYYCVTFFHICLLLDMAHGRHIRWERRMLYGMVEHTEEHSILKSRFNHKKWRFRWKNSKELNIWWWHPTIQPLPLCSWFCSAGIRLPMPITPERLIEVFLPLNNSKI